MIDVTLGDRAVGLATAAARDLGLNPAGAAIHRHIVSVHVELPAAGVIARVEARDRLAIAQLQVRVARLLESRKLPAARLVLPERQPLIYGDGVVTLWEAVVILERRPDAAVLGRLARRLHEATAGFLPAEIPDIDPLILDPRVVASDRHGDWRGGREALGRARMARAVMGRDDRR